MADDRLSQDRGMKGLQERRVRNDQEMKVDLNDQMLEEGSHIKEDVEKSRVDQLLR